MIAPEFVNELQRLNREEKLEVIRLLQDDLVDESSAWDRLVSDPGHVIRIIGPIRASAETIEQFEALSKALNTDG